MREQGLLDYDEKVATYWPEFAQNGKENITVRQLVSHEAGLHRLPMPMQLEWAQADAIRQNAIGKIFEQEAPHQLPHGAKRIYHSMTKDLLTNELFRRVEPEGRTMGQYMREVINPEFDFDIHLGMEKETIPRCYHFGEVGGWRVFKDLWRGPETRYSAVSIGQLGKLGELTTNVDKACDATTPNPARTSKTQEYAAGKDFKLF